MKNTLILTLSLPVVAACSTGATTDPTIYAIDPSDSIQAALVEGQTVTGKSVLSSAVLANRETGRVTKIDPRTFSMQLPTGTDEDITITVGDEVITFTAMERRYEEDGVTYYGWAQEGESPTYEFWAWSNGTANNSISLGETDYTAIWEIQHYDRGLDYLAYAVTGVETPDDMISDLATATYEGYVGIKAYPDGSYDGFDTVNRLEGNAEITANFGSGTISGEISNLRWGWTGDRDSREDIDGVIVMDATAIASDGAYSGSLTPDAAFDANGVVSSSGGSYTGEFFGPEAENAAGAISMNMSADGTDYVGAGFFNTRVND